MGVMQCADVGKDTHDVRRESTHTNGTRQTRESSAIATELGMRVESPAPRGALLLGE